MDYLQYMKKIDWDWIFDNIISFKPCYKWITFNTSIKQINTRAETFVVLNLVINGLPSIQKILQIITIIRRFKF